MTIHDMIEKIIIAKLQPKILKEFNESGKCVQQMYCCGIDKTTNENELVELPANGTHSLFNERSRSDFRRFIEGYLKLLRLSDESMEHFVVAITESWVAKQSDCERDGKHLRPAEAANKREAILIFIYHQHLDYIHVCEIRDKPVRHAIPGEKLQVLVGDMVRRGANTL